MRAIHGSSAGTEETAMRSRIRSPINGANGRVVTDYTFAIVTRT